MATTPGQRFVRRHDAARSSTSNTTAADISYDTAVISEGGYSWTSPEVTVDEAGLYLCIFDIGEVQLASTRAVGTLVPSVNTVDQTYYKARHRYLRNSGGNHNVSWGACILDLSVNDDVKIRNPGTVSGTDALGNYATNVNQGGGFQLIRLNAGNFTEVRRTTSQSPITITYANTTRPWLDSTLSTTQITFNSEVRDDDNLYSGSGGDLTLAANTKYLILYGATLDGSSSQRHTHHLQLEIDGTNVQYATGYERNNSSDGPPMQGMYLHETGGTTETLRLNAGVEQEDAAVSNTVGCDNAYVQVLELPTGAEWIHVDNGTTDSLTTAWAGTSTYYDTPLSSTLRADGDSNLSLDGTNNAVQNDSGGSLPVLAIGWHMTDRDAGTSGTRKHSWCYWDNGGTRLAYGITGGYNRGQQGNDDTHRLAYTGAATLDLANGADLSWVTRDPVSGANSDMGVYASTSRYFLGVQVLNLNTLVSGGTDVTAEPPAGSLTITGRQPTVTETWPSYTAEPPADALTLTALTPDKKEDHVTGMRPGGMHVGNKGLLLQGITPTVDLTTGSDELVEPPSGSASLTGLQPSAEITHIREVPQGALDTQGLQPDAQTTENQVIGVPSGALTVEGLAPSAEIEHIRFMPVGAIDFTSYAPTAGASENQVRAPPAGTLQLAALAPALRLSIALPAGDLNLQGYAPTSGEDHVAEMPEGSLSATGLAPGLSVAVYVPHTELHVVGGRGLRLDGYQPTILIQDSGDELVEPLLGSLTLNALTPSAEEDHVAEMPLGSLSLTQYVPTAVLTENVTSLPTLGGLTLTGLAPELSTNFAVEIPKGSLTLTGLAPSLEGSLTATPDVGGLSITGHAPVSDTPISFSTLKRLQRRRGPLTSRPMGRRV